MSCLKNSKSAYTAVASRSVSLRAYVPSRVSKQHVRRLQYGSARVHSAQD